MMVTARNTFGRSSSELVERVGNSAYHTGRRERERGRGARARGGREGGGVAERVEYKCIRWA